MYYWKNGVKYFAPDPPDDDDASAWESTSEYRMNRIAQLKEQLASTDYKALKYFEGWLTEAEYAPIKEMRQSLRDEINAIEKSLTEVT